QDLSSQGVVDWYWDMPEGDPPSSQEPSPRVSYPTDTAGAYLVTLVVADEHGCMDTTTSIIRIDGVFSVHVPNAFTPDGDEVNDLFLPIVRDAVPEDYHLMIFDRWGRLVHETRDPGQGWDGK